MEQGHVQLSINEPLLGVVVDHTIHTIAPLWGIIAISILITDGVPQLCQRHKAAPASVALDF